MISETDRLYAALEQAGWKKVDEFHWQSPDGGYERFPNAVARLPIDVQAVSVPDAPGTWLAVMPQDGLMPDMMREKIIALLEAKGIKCIVFPMPVQLDIVEILVSNGSIDH